MASKMANQVDLAPVSGTFVTVHVPSGQSNAVASNPSDAPAVTAKSNSPSGGKSIQTTVAGVRFSNPS